MRYHIEIRAIESTRRTDMRGPASLSPPPTKGGGRRQGLSLFLLILLQTPPRTNLLDPRRHGRLARLIVHALLLGEALPLERVLLGEHDDRAARRWQPRCGGVLCRRGREHGRAPDGRRRRQRGVPAHGRRSRHGQAGEGPGEHVGKREGKEGGGGKSKKTRLCSNEK